MSNRDRAAVKELKENLLLYAVNDAHILEQL